MNSKADLNILKKINIADEYKHYSQDDITVVRGYIIFQKH